MQTINIKSNGQLTLNIPKDIVQALGWKDGDTILVSKMPEKNYLVIECLQG